MPGTSEGRSNKTGSTAGMILIEKSDGWIKANQS
jgi:hypothetical protein